MKPIKKLVSGLSIVFLIASCSVQQFPVNTTVEPFQKASRLFGERTKGAKFRKDGDLHILGINAKKSNVEKMVQELKATSYTIESKSNLIVQLLTFGMVDYKIVKVIKRGH